MAVAFGAKGATLATTTATNLSVAYPTGITAGQKLVLSVFTLRAGGATVNTPSGWGVVPNSPSPVVTSIQVHVFTKIAVGTESGTLSVTIAAAPSGALSFISRYTTSLGYFDSDAAGDGSETGTAADAEWQVTTAQTIERVSGDRLIAFAAGNGATLRTWGTESIAGAAVTGVRDNTQLTAQSLQSHVSDAVAPSTSTSTILHQGDITVGGNQSGSGIVLRLRDFTKNSVGILHG